MDHHPLRKIPQLLLLQGLVQVVPHTRAHGLDDLLRVPFVGHNGVDTPQTHGPQVVRHFMAPEFSQSGAQQRHMGVQVQSQIHTLHIGVGCHDHGKAVGRPIQQIFDGFTALRVIDDEQAVHGLPSFPVHGLPSK